MNHLQCLAHKTYNTHEEAEEHIPQQGKQPPQEQIEQSPDVKVSNSDREFTGEKQVQWIKAWRIFDKYENFEKETKTIELKRIVS